MDHGSPAPGFPASIESVIAVVGNDSRGLVRVPPGLVQSGLLAAPGFPDSHPGCGLVVFCLILVTCCSAIAFDLDEVPTPCEPEHPLESATMEERLGSVPLPAPNEFGRPPCRRLTSKFVGSAGRDAYPQQIDRTRPEVSDRVCHSRGSACATGRLRPPISSHLYSKLTSLPGNFAFLSQASARASSEKYVLFLVSYVLESHLPHGPRLASKALAAPNRGSERAAFQHRVVVYQSWQNVSAPPSRRFCAIHCVRRYQRETGFPSESALHRPGKPLNSARC